MKRYRHVLYRKKASFFNILPLRRCIRVSCIRMYTIQCHKNAPDNEILPMHRLNGNTIIRQNNMFVWITKRKERLIALNSLAFNSYTG